MIKTADGERSVASAGVGGAALGTGIAGLSVALLNGGLGNLLGGLGGCNQYASKSDIAYSQELAKKDSEIALLKSEQNTEVKIADVYDRLITKINANKEEQTAINMQQAVYNGTNNATVSCLQGQIAQLASLSQLVVPSRNVCDTGCCNG